MLKALIGRYGKAAWNGPFYIGPLVQPISLGSALIKVLEVGWRAAMIGVVGLIVVVSVEASWAVIAPAFAPPPKDQEECKIAAASKSDSAAAQEDCERKFPAVWHEGGYSLYIPETMEWVRVSGPTPTPADYRNIKDIRDRAVNLERRRIDALANFKVKSYKITCNVDSRYISCYDKNITVNLVNSSDMTISGLRFSYEIGSGLDCSGSLGKNFYQPMRVLPHETGSFVHNVKFDAAGPNGSLAGCLRLEGVDRIE